MMRSMYSGVSGLKVHQTKMDVIANNIANVNTTGYKSQRATFSDFFSQTSASATKGSGGRGGTNAMQIGIGVALSSVDTSMNSGAAQRTDRPFDLMIEGDSFFIVGDGNTNYFTRNGNFNLNLSSGGIVNSDGLFVQGWGVREVLDSTGRPTGEYEPVRDVVKPLVFDAKTMYSAPQSTSTVTASGNLNGSESAEVKSTIAFFDSVGNRWVQDTKMVWNETKQVWDQQFSNIAYLNGDRDKPYELKVSGGAGAIKADFVNPPVAAPAETWTTVGSIGFDSNGQPSATASAGGTLIPKYTVTAPKGSILQDATFGQASKPGEIALDFSALTMYGNEEASLTNETTNGYKPGSLNNMIVAADGSIIGQYTNGQSRLIAMIPVAKFKNPAGLEKAGGSLYVATQNSGDFDGIGSMVTDSGGAMRGGVLEMSNVDLSQEFTDMITTQRGFQANSRTITTSDEFLQELVNLKR